MYNFSWKTWMKSINIIKTKILLYILFLFYQIKNKDIFFLGKSMLFQLFFFIAFGLYNDLIIFVTTLIKK